MTLWQHWVDVKRNWSRERQRGQGLKLWGAAPQSLQVHCMGPPPRPFCCQPCGAARSEWGRCVTCLLTGPSPDTRPVAHGRHLQLPRGWGAWLEAEGSPTSTVHPIPLTGHPLGSRGGVFQTLQWLWPGSLLASQLKLRIPFGPWLKAKWPANEAKVEIQRRAGLKGGADGDWWGWCLAGKAVFLRREQVSFSLPP